MEFISYNSVQLQIVATNYVSIVPVNNDDNTAFLGSDWDIDVVCHVQPFATSYNAKPDGSPFASPNQTPGTTINAIKAALETPRGILTITAGQATILDVPALFNGVRQSCDPAHGPFCKVFSIRQIIGVRHFVCHCRFTARVNTNNNIDSAQGQQTPILSNTWTTIEDIDDLLYPIRTIAGQAILRADVMRRQQLTAASFRNFFFFPVPANYQRESASVELSSDGLTLTYTIRDEGKCYNLGAGSPVRRFEGYMNGHVKTSGHGRPFAQAGQGLASSLINNPTGFIGTLLGAPARLYNNVEKNLNQYYFQVRADLWGERNASKGDLFDIGVSLILNQLRNLPGAGVSQMEFTARSALHEKYVSVEATHSWGDDLLVFTFSNQGGIRGLANKFRGNDRTLNLVSNDPLFTTTIPGQGTVFASQSNVTPPFNNPPFGGAGANVGTQAAGGLNQDTNALAAFITALLLNPQQFPTPPAQRYPVQPANQPALRPANAPPGEAFTPPLQES